MPKKPRTLRLNDDTKGKAKGRGGAKSFQWLDLTTKTVNIIGSDDKKHVYCNFCRKTWGHPCQPTFIGPHLIHKCRKCPEVQKQAATDSLISRSLTTALMGSDNDGSNVEQGGMQNSQPSIAMLARKAGQDKTLLKVNSSIVDMICAGGIPPEFCSTIWWKNFMTEMDPLMQTASTTTFAQTYIPAEATCIMEQVIGKLQRIKNLTILFDGGTTHVVQSIYTVHIITPIDCVVYLVEGNSASDVSHTAEHISKVVMKVRNMYYFKVTTC